MEDKRLRIAVAGGGLGGLTLAIALAKYVPDLASRLKVDIYESTKSLEAQVGAGLGMWPYSWSIVEALGLGEEMSKYAGAPITTHPQPFFNVRKSDQYPEGRELFTLHSGGGGFISFHRGQFQSVLLRNAPSSVAIHTKKRLATYTKKGDEITIHFEDGTTAQCDLLIGADGLQSNVRRTMLRELADNGALLPPGSLPEGISQEEYLERLSSPYWTGNIVYRYLIPVEKLKASGWGHHRVFSGDLVDVGKYASIMSYLVGRGKMVNFVGLRSWPEMEGTVYNDELIPQLLENKFPKDEDLALARLEEKAEPATTKPDTTDENRYDPWAGNGGGSSKRGRSRWVCPVDKSEVKEAFKGWETDIQALIEQVDEPLRWATHGTYPLPTNRSGMVLLMGDAAHSMLPYVGQGAAQALADAFMLAQLISAVIDDKQRDIKARLHAALEAFDLVRRPIANLADDLSRDNMLRWNLFSRNDKGELIDVDTWNPKDMDNMRQHMEHNWSIGWEKDGPAKEVERALSLYKRSLRLGTAHM